MNKCGAVRVGCGVTVAQIVLADFVFSVTRTSSVKEFSELDALGGLYREPCCGCC